MLEILFHGCRSSQETQADIEKRVAALTRFDANLGDVKVIVDKVARMAPGEYCVRVEVKTGAGQSVFASESHADQMQAVNLVFDAVKRLVKDANEKRHSH